MAPNEGATGEAESSPVNITSILEFRSHVTAREAPQLSNLTITLIVLFSFIAGIMVTSLVYFIRRRKRVESNQRAPASLQQYELLNDNTVSSSSN